MTKRMTYLAVPYSCNKFPGRLLMWWRYRKVTKIAAHLMGRGFNVFSPITHSHAIATIGKLPALNHEFWLELDKWYVNRCAMMHVLMIDGWEKSKGVRREIRWALEQGKPVYGLDRFGNTVKWILEVP